MMKKKSVKKKQISRKSLNEIKIINLLSKNELMRCMS